MTLKELIEKHPLIFQQYEGNPGGVNWHVPNAWIPVIDNLCGAIQSYINTYRRSKPNPAYVEGSEWVADDITTHKYVSIAPNQVTCTQMKEKFGGLRFYINGGDDYVEGMIHMAEYMCENMCQYCGTKENLGITGGWITICCKECSKESSNWKPKSIINENNLP